MPTNLNPLICLFIFLIIHLCGLSQENVKEDLSVVSKSQEHASKNISNKKNVMYVMPAQFFQTTLNLGYERLLNTKNGIYIHYYRIVNESTNEYNLHYQHYFKQTDALDLNFDNLRIKGFYLEYFTGIAFRYADNNENESYSARIPIGTKVQFKKGISVMLSGLVGPGIQKGIKDQLYTDWGILFGLGYRF